MKTRERQRENRRAKVKEEKLSKYDSSGIKDLTPYNAVQLMRTNGKANIVLK